jgi:outer membrane murein-binding lipoprotein Lpp
MTLRELALFFLLIFLVFSPVVDAGAQNEPPASAPQGNISPQESLETKIQKLEKDFEALMREAEARKTEAEARRKLEPTEEEKAEEEKRVLTTAGRSYTLMEKGTMCVEYNFRYSYYSVDQLLFEPVAVHHEKLHELYNHISVDYALRDNLTVTGAIPFIYRYESVGASDSTEQSSIGDISFGARWQPFKSGGAWPATTFYANISAPTGESPYEINIDDELSTGSGFWSCSIGASFSKAIDPVVAFGQLGFSYNFEVDGLEQKHGSRVLEKVEPGSDIAFSIGLGYALSYAVSLTMRFTQNIRLETDYTYKDGKVATAPSYVSSIFCIGTGWRLSNKTTIFVDVGLGLTTNDPDFYLSFRLPFDFAL